VSYRWQAQTKILELKNRVSEFKNMIETLIVGWIKQNKDIENSKTYIKKHRGRNRKNKMN
jgi:hypothetical protein